MNRSLVSFLLGACALSTTYTAGRLIAPFYGFGPLLVSASLAVSFLALGAGFLLAAQRPGSRSPGDAHRPGTGAAALLVAAAWTILVPWLRVAALATFERFGLRAAAILGTVLFAGVPLAALGFGMGGSARPSVATDADRSGGAAIAAALFGAAIAAPVVVWLSVPLLGVSRTLFVVGAVEAIAAWLARSGARAGATAVPAVALLAISALSAGRFPAIARDAAHGLVEAREGPMLQYRVLDREDGRFLLADGGIESLVSAETRDALLRPAAALQVLDLFFAQPESALVLGLRGGAVAKQFARAGWKVRVVEPDPLAVRVASDHLSFHASEVRLAVEDVRAFCRRDTSHYPVVILDAFGASAIPFHLITREALATVAGRVAGDGTLALVLVTRGWNDPVICTLAAELHELFRSVLALPTGEPPDALGSVVMLASNRRLDLPDERLPQPTDFLINPDEHWAVVQMNHAWFNRFEPPVRGAVILTDDRNPIDLWSDPVQNAARAELHRSFADAPTSW